ncbi:cyclic nucleotide-binding domain-containing protein [Aeromicrobium sp. NPDC092404]|uniref:cyclic nucleotide-binding domain-containing protein n=1 Tax=Aeromicrobium sp. NPDC092404 TaxID=3154976 RepID=UPI003414806D
MIRKQKLDPEVQKDLTRVTDFDADLVKALATVGVQVHVPQGWSIMMESTPGDSAYILLDGEVEIRKSGEVLRSLGPGAVFGEIALVGHRLRSASVVASTDISALRLEETAVETLSQMNPAFAETLRSTAASRLESS